MALANKETLITGGHLVAAVLGASDDDPLDRLRPIDSEHSAIWQCLVGERIEDVRRLVLTASGGPFRDRDPKALAAVSPADALAHPTWRMGPKITVDSATLVNKAFEVIEAKWLYRLPYPKIEAVIHPQSIVHSLVEFVDGSFKAQLGMPDMRLPIQYALTYPARLPSPARSSHPADWERLDFAPLRPAAYPAYDVVRAAAEAGGNRGTVLNAADEVAVKAFLDGRIAFPAIAETIESAIERWGASDEPDLASIAELDSEVRTQLSTGPERGGPGMIEIIGTIAAFLGVLVVLVLVHELGHFVVAKRAGITVQEFGIGFPPRVGSVMWHGTRYSLNWIPLGGFVKMLGEDGDVEVRRLREQGMTSTEVEQAMAGAFNRKPLWIRVGVLLAGVAMNFVLAAGLFAVALSLPIPLGHGPLTVVSVQDSSPAQGRLEIDDVITAADGRSFERSADLTEYVASRAGFVVDLTVIRDDAELEVSLIPRSVSQEDRQRGIGPVGFSYEPERLVDEPSTVTGPLDAIGRGTSAAATLAAQIPGGLASAVGGLIGLNPDGGDALGPIGIAQETGRVLQAPLVSQLLFVGVLSINLAVLNVLPFPPLDGGRIMVVMLEAARRRRLPAEREALIYLTGFAVLLALVILISIQDIQRLVTGRLSEPAGAGNWVIGYTPGRFDRPFDEPQILN